MVYYPATYEEDPLGLSCYCVDTIGLDTYEQNEHWTRSISLKIVNLDLWPGLWSFNWDLPQTMVHYPAIGVGPLHIPLQQIVVTLFFGPRLGISVIFRPWSVTLPSTKTVPWTVGLLLCLCTPLGNVHLNEWTHCNIPIEWLITILWQMRKCVQVYI